RTMADGLKPKALGELTFQVIREQVDDMLTVSEAEIRATLRFLWNRMKLVIEPSGAVSLAPVYHALPRFKGKRVGVILSGGNADIGAVADWMRAPTA
ncbi:MAG: pyridoxal-phosphate dependent enzyme, partial [Deltaproteobacteria bacterium]|nr:pyridoxal-phosphate dependent enzyme [Deltaproteobacteria bacterium]